MKNSIFNSIVLSLVIFVASLAPASSQKLTAEEVISKHLDSIGSKDKRASVKNQMIFSDLKFQARGNTAVSYGKAVILSEADKSLWGYNLNSNTYPQDRFGFNGKETQIGYARPGVRSALGEFILSYKEILKEGLLGGTMISSWALLNRDVRKAKIQFDGTKKVDERETYVLNYSPKGGSDLNIKMYFDAETFRHLRTEYSRVISARQGPTVDTSARQSPIHYRLTETFSDFQAVDGLTIPKTYKLLYSVTAATTTTANSELEWTFSVTNLSLNQNLDRDSFNIDAK
jgi:hypothetical protein